MRLIVADTSPIYYLVCIDEIEILPRLFQTVLVPGAVHNELLHPSAPIEVRAWATSPPSWLEVMEVADADDPALQVLDQGERSAIALALSIHADLILIDERKGARVALSKGFEITGTLGVLALAARSGLLNLADAFARLKTTNFRYRQAILDEILQQHLPTEEE